MTMTFVPDNAAPAFWTAPPGPRVPRIALMGEFSAGKSTLLNLLIERDLIPTRATATRSRRALRRAVSLPPRMVSVQGRGFR